MYEKMDPQIKAMWLTALRSGDYKQGRSRLKDYIMRDGEMKPVHCCLGVLAEELVNHMHPLASCIRVNEREITVRGTHDGKSHEELKGILSDELALALQLLQSPEEEDDRFQSIMWMLAQHNDATDNDDTWDFNKIANWVEANL